MKKSFQLKPLLLSMAVAGAATMSIAPATTHAEVSYSAAVSNMYLWRGQQISEDSGVVSGSIDYAHESGLYAGVWTSSEGAAGSTETDLYGGYAPTFGDVSLNIGYAAYFYPEAGTSSSFDTDEGSLISEYILGASYKDFSATAFINTEGSDADNYMYLSLDYGMGDFGFHYGMTTSDDSADEYTDINVSYAATDALSFTLSTASGNAIDAQDQKPKFQITYSLPI